MTIYLDSSAFALLYLNQDGAESCRAAVADDRRWTTARHAFVEVGRAINRCLPPATAPLAQAEFDADWVHVHIIEIDAQTCQLAYEIAIETGARTLDALHLAAVWRAGGDTVKLLTRDIRQARAARELGIELHPASI